MLLPILQLLQLLVLVALLDRLEHGLRPSLLAEDGPRILPHLQVALLPIPLDLFDSALDFSPFLFGFLVLFLLLNFLLFLLFFHVFKLLLSGFLQNLLLSLTFLLVYFLSQTLILLHLLVIPPLFFEVALSHLVLLNLLILSLRTLSRLKIINQLLLSKIASHIQAKPQHPLHPLFAVGLHQDLGVVV